ncbi:MAG: type II secretion system protein [Lentisphaeria bacterium]|nr:type II secretion system protein [Lentisphaeria bacterium]
MKTRKCFTLVELLVVAGIIALLAGLILPAVIGGAQQGRITQAKSDMNAIQMAFSQMDQTYHRVLKKESDGKVKFLDDNAVSPIDSGDDSSLSEAPKNTEFVILGKKNDNSAVNNHEVGSTKLTQTHEDAYNGLIAELTVMGRSSTYSQNTRKTKFLEPNKNYDPTKAYTDDANKPYLWRDPWGNPYSVMINTNGTERLIKPDNPSSGKYIMTKTAVWSRGPNGEDNQGKNANEGGGKLDDDIATWHK